MNIISLREAQAEAERFLIVSKRVKVETLKCVSGPKKMVTEYTKESAACRRASMDLTRALARLRNE